MIVAQSRPALCDPMEYRVHGILQVQILEWVAIPFSRGSSQPRDQTQVSRIAGRFFTSWVTREDQEYCCEQSILLERIFQSQESNQGLLHGRRILYQLTYQGSCSVQSLSRVRLFATPWIAASQASLSITNFRISPMWTKKYDAFSYIKTMKKIILSSKIKYLFGWAES